MSKDLYFFEEGDGSDKELLGGKGAGLCAMTQLSLPIPPGFVITTEVCKEYQKTGDLPEGLMDKIEDAIEKVGKRRGAKFGKEKNPLLVSVRSGAAISMPGMMDTILNIGLNDETVEGLSERTNERFAYDSYRRLIQMFGSINLGIPEEKFEEVLSEYKEKVGAEHDTDLGADGLKKVVEKFREIVEEESERGFPSDSFKQLELSIRSVFDSWDTERAKEYREANDIPDDLGTAVNVVAMIFGNVDSNSGSGVMFTRNPSTGEKELYGEYLPKAQGEDVVAGVRTPLEISELEGRHPEIYEQLSEIAEKLENYYREMQDMEFTVEQEELYILQTRDGKRTGRAAVKIAVDMVEEGLIDKKEAVERVKTKQLRQLLSKRVDPEADVDIIAEGIDASPGVAIGEVVFNVMEAKRLGKKGKDLILVRPKTAPSDVGGVNACRGVLTSEGGKSSHAAIVSREMGKPAVVGCDKVQINSEEDSFKANEFTVKKGETITIDGSQGQVILGEASLVEPEKSEELEKLLSWRKEVKNK